MCKISLLKVCQISAMADKSESKIDALVGEEGQEPSAANRTQDYEKLIEYGLDSKVAEKLDDIYQTGKNCTYSWQRKALSLVFNAECDCIRVESR